MIGFLIISIAVIGYVFGFSEAYIKYNRPRGEIELPAERLDILNHI